MTARKPLPIANYFSGAKQSQQLTEAEDEIQQLKAEIEQLRSQGATVEAPLEALRSQLQSQSGVLSIPIDKIQPNPEQPRKTFRPDSIESMCRSLEKEGQLQPIILIQRGDSYLLFDGERRWRSAKKLGQENLQAVIIPELDSADLHRKALLTSLHREDLNSLDKAEAILQELAIATELEGGNIPRILSTAVRRLNRQGQTSQVAELMTQDAETQQQSLASLGLDGQEQDVLGRLLELQLNPASVDANVFPMLSLADDLKTAIRESGLFGVHVIALSKLSAKNLGQPEAKAKAIRVKTTEKVVAEKLSAQETRKLVAAVITSQAQPSTGETKRVKGVAIATGNLQKLSGELLATVERSQLEEFQAVLQQKLAEIKTVLEQK